MNNVDNEKKKKIAKTIGNKIYNLRNAKKRIFSRKSEFISKLYL